MAGQRLAICRRSASSKRQAYQDGHAGYSDPIDEQAFVVNTINFLEASADVEQHRRCHHVRRLRRMVRTTRCRQIVNQSQSAGNDALTGAGLCGAATPVLVGYHGQTAQGRCGYGPRLPMVVVSPYAKQNFVDHTLTDQTSVIRFVEDTGSVENESVMDPSIPSRIGSPICSASIKIRTSRNIASGTLSLEKYNASAGTVAEFIVRVCENQFACPLFLD